jgi:hypothetical protein
VILYYVRSEIHVPQHQLSLNLVSLVAIRMRQEELFANLAQRDTFVIAYQEQFHQRFARSVAFVLKDLLLLLHASQGAIKTTPDLFIAIFVPKDTTVIFKMEHYLENYVPLVPDVP